MSEHSGDPGETAAVLRAVLAEVEAGRISAELDHAAYLRGAADALQLAAGQGGRAVSEPSL